MKFASKVILFLLLATVARAEDFVLKVDDSVLTKKEFDEKYKVSSKFFRFKAPTKENILEDVIKLEVGVAEAKKMGLDKDPIFQDQVKQLLYQALVDKMLAPKFKAFEIKDADVKKYYESNPEIRTSHIYVQVRTDAKKEDDAKALAKIKDIEKKLKESGKSFADIATEYSEGVVNQTGGDIDWQTKDKLDPAYYQTAKGLKVGNVSPIIRSQFGYHIIMLTGVKKWEEANQAEIKKMYFDEKRIEMLDNLIEGLKKKHRVVVNKTALK